MSLHRGSQRIDNDSQVQTSPRLPGVPGLQRRGTISFVKNVMMQKIQRANMSSVNEGSIAQDRNGSIRDLKSFGGLPMRGRTKDPVSLAMAPGGPGLSPLVGGDASGGFGAAANEFESKQYAGNQGAASG